jgi:enoyl-CoA hydratase/carnithine racemase
VVEAEEAYRIGLLNHLVPCAQLRDKTLELAAMIASNRREAAMGVRALLFQHMGRNLEEQWAAERDYTTRVVRGARAEEASPSSSPAGAAPAAGGSLTPHRKVQRLGYHPPGAPPE